MKYTTLRKSLILAAILLIGSKQSALASGDYTNYWAKPNAQCERASRPENAVRSGTKCRFTVHFSYSACPDGERLDQCFSLDRPIEYWLEQRSRGGSSWRRITNRRVFDYSSVNETIEIGAEQSLSYRVAFDYYGQKTFADDYSRIFSVNVKGR